MSSTRAEVVSGHASAALGPDEFPTRQGPSDTILWVIERDPVLRSTVVAVALLDETPAWSVLRDRVAAAVRDIPRLRQRVREPWLRVGPARWQPCDVDLDYHLRRVTASSPADLRSVLDFAQISATTPFDRERPLWEFTLVEGVGGSGAAFVQKLHHSLTDGIGLVRLALALYDVVPETEERSVRPASPARVTPAEKRPDQEGVQAGPLTAAASIARLLAPAFRPRSKALAGRGLSWRFDVLDIPLEQLREVAHAHGASLNDAFVTAVARGLGLYHARHHVPADRLRALMPISIRNASDPAGGNRFVPARLDVPVSVADPGHHVQMVHDATSAVRAEPSIRHVPTLAGALSWLPRPVTAALFGSMLKGCDFVVTDVPGFDRPVRLAGAPVSREYAFAPPSGSAVNVALLSHGDTACIGINLDTRAVDDPTALLDCLRAGFVEVLESVPRSALDLDAAARVERTATETTAGG